MKNVLVLASLALVLSSCFEKKEEAATQNSVTTEAAAPAEAAPADAAPADAAHAEGEAH